MVKFFEQIDASTFHMDALQQDAPPCQMVALQTAFPPLAAISVPPDPFKYEELPLSSEERTHLQLCRHRIITVRMAGVIETGQHLLTAKGLLLPPRCKNGVWGKWLREALSVSRTTAYNYMAATEWYLKNPTVGQLGQRALYCGGTASEEIKAELERMLEHGEILTLKQVQHLKDGNKEDVASRKDAGDQLIENIPFSDDSPVPTENQVALEFVARLREIVDDQTIADLIDLIDRTTILALRHALAG